MRENWLSNRVFKSYQKIVDVLRGLEQTDRPALAHHVHRNARMGPPVLISESWYKPKRRAAFLGNVEATFLRW